MHIRPFKPGDEAALWQIFHSAVHQTASRDYSAEQLQAWAPDAVDPEQWRQRIQALQPFVVESSDKSPHPVLLGYADLQRTSPTQGYIDHFFVGATYARQGVGRYLMQHLLSVAQQDGLEEISADVSLTAQPFFAQFGFDIVSQKNPVIRGVGLSNALMRKQLRQIKNNS